MSEEEPRSLWKLIGLGSFIPSLCCFPSIVWVLFAGSSSIAAADQLSNDLYYGPVRPILYVVSAVMLVAGLVIHFRSHGICTLEQAQRDRRKVVNTTLAVFTTVIVIYLVWNYVVLEILGIALGLPWEESAFWN